MKRRIVYKVNFKDIDEKKHHSIASQILNETNTKVFKFINNVFWIKMIVQIMLFIIFLIIILVVWTNQPPLDKEVPFDLWIAILVFIPFNIFSQVFINLFSNIRTFYLKAMYIYLNNEGNFSETDLVDLKKWSLDWESTYCKSLKRTLYFPYIKATNPRANRGFGFPL